MTSMEVEVEEVGTIIRMEVKMERTKLKGRATRSRMRLM